MATEMSPAIKPMTAGKQLWGVNSLWVFTELLQHRCAHCTPHDSGHTSQSTSGAGARLCEGHAVNVWGLGRPGLKARPTRL